MPGLTRSCYGPSERGVGLLTEAERAVPITHDINLKAICILPIDMPNIFWQFQS